MDAANVLRLAAGPYFLSAQTQTTLEMPLGLINPEIMHN
jgi:hypothetical protein